MTPFSMKNQSKEIGVIGLWHLGSVYAASLARLGHSVTGFDYDTEVVTNLQNGKPPLFEPELDETLASYKTTLRFTSDSKELFAGKDYLFVTFDLPVNDMDIVDTALIQKTFPLIAEHIQEKTCVVVSSQVPLGTCRTLVQLLSEQNKQNPVIYFPENLRLGTAFESFLQPDRVILGSDSQNAMKQFEQDFSELRCPVISMKLESAEMVKHALNTYLALCVSYSSEISDICELLGADMREVITALKTDKRVSPKAPLNPGLGFAGGTLGRDIQSLQALGNQHDYDTKLMKTIYRVNQDRLPSLIQKMKRVFSTLKDKKINILGLTYKPGTNTLRRSMSLGLAELLHAEGAVISAFDPVITDEVPSHPYIQVASSAEEACHQADMLVVMTEWPDFTEINPLLLAKAMKQAVIIDTKNVLDGKAYSDAGFRYMGTGY